MHPFLLYIRHLHHPKRRLSEIMQIKADEHTEYGRTCLCTCLLASPHMLSTPRPEHCSSTSVSRWCTCKELFRGLLILLRLQKTLKPRREPLDSGENNVISTAQRGENATRPADMCSNISHEECHSNVQVSPSYVCKQHSRDPPTLLSSQTIPNPRTKRST
jgi:hypothetical protein